MMFVVSCVVALQLTGHFHLLTAHFSLAYKVLLKNLTMAGGSVPVRRSSYVYSPRCHVLIHLVVSFCLCVFAESMPVSGNAGSTAEAL